MGYACPVCEEPQVDAEHLANHLAFTAILRDGEHESWLDEHVPTWGEQDPAALGAAVAEYAESVTIDLPDDAGDTSGSRPGDPTDHPTRPTGHTGATAERLSREDRAVLEEARELTRKMLRDAKPEETGKDQENRKEKQEPSETERPDSEKE